MPALKLRSPRRAPRAPRGRLKLYVPQTQGDTATPTLPDVQRGSEAYREVAAQAHAQVLEPEWDEFLDIFRGVWKQGEHVTLYAATGQGKTSLALEILPIRKWMVVFATKQKYQRLMSVLKARGFKVEKEFDPNPETTPKVILHCAPKDTGAKARLQQKHVYGHALDVIYKAGGWGLYIDELKYITDNLKLAGETELLYLQGRELGVSIIGTSQRPAWVPVVAIAEATHLFIGAQSDRRDIDRIAEGAGRKGAVIRPLIQELEDYQFLYVHTRSSKVPIYKVKVNLEG